MEEIQKDTARGCGRCVFPSLRVEGKGECEGNASAAERGALRLHAPVKTRCNSVFDCINRAL